MQKKSKDCLTRWFKECRVKFLNICEYICLCFKRCKGCKGCKGCKCKYCFAEETLETENSEDILICKRCKYIPCCFVCRWCCIFFFGCCGCSFDDKGRLKCFHLHSTDLKSGTNEYRTVKCNVCCVKHEDENQIPDEDMEETEFKQLYEENTEPKELKNNDNDDSESKVTHGEDNKTTRTEDKNERECQAKEDEETKNICKAVKSVAKVHSGAKKNQFNEEIELEMISFMQKK